jgi:hypothetical protein
MTDGGLDGRIFPDVRPSDVRYTFDGRTSRLIGLR